MATLDKGIKERTLYGVITFIILICAMSVFDYFLYLLGESIWAITGLATWIVWITIAMIRLLMLQNKHKIDENNLSINNALTEIK